MDDLISRKAVAEHMKVWAGCDKCDHYNYVRCRACSWDDAMACVDAEESVPAVPLDKLCDWLNQYDMPCEMCEEYLGCSDEHPCGGGNDGWKTVLTKWMKEE